MAHNARALTPPQPQRRPVQITKHVDMCVNELFWLHERDHPEVLHLLAAVNDFTAAAMAHTQLLQEIEYEEMVGRSHETDAIARLPDQLAMDRGGQLLG